jgi:carbon monoxide dehydrogenase subunit G
VRIAGAYIVPIPLEQAYATLQDPVVLARCMPGCDGLVKVGEDTYEMKMKMLIASISGSFDGKVKITEQHPPESFKLTVEGAGRIGFTKGEGVLSLSTVDAGTEVRYEGDVSVGGTIASVGQRLIDTTAKMMIKRFFDKLVETAATASA